MQRAIIVSGAGVGGQGVLISTAATPQTNALGLVTLAGDATFGGTARWDIRGPSPSVASAILSTSNLPCNLTKTGSNQISLAAVIVDSALANVDVRQGTLSLEYSTTSLGNPANTLTVEPGATLSFHQTTAPWNKQFVLNGDGLTTTVASDGTNNTLVGPVTLNGNCNFGVSNGALMFAGPISGPGGLTQNLPGRLCLGGTNAYAGNSTVNAGTLALTCSNALANSPQITLAAGTFLDASALSAGLTLNAGQTLGGSGAVNGSLTVGGGAVLAPANPFSTFTFSNSLTFTAGSDCILKISRSPATNDLIRVLGTLTFGGKLVVSNVSASALAAGDSFKLFDAPAITGAFVISPQIPGPSLVWDTSTFASNGVLRVIAGSTPHFSPIARNGNRLFLSGAGGQPGTPYYILTATNLGLPINQWTRIVTNYFDATGNFAATNSFTPQSAATYFLLQFP